MLNRESLVLMLISIERMLLAVTQLVIVSSFSFDDIVGQTNSIYIIAIAGAGRTVGLMRSKGAGHRPVQRPTAI